MIETLPLLQKSDFPSIHRDALTTLQVNLGYVCNQQCVHCHVNAGPKRSESMKRENIDYVLYFLKNSTVNFLDLTGGAPELNPNFGYLVEQARALNINVMDRCNLTILNEPGQENLASFLASHQVEVTASLPCYLQNNVDQQRGKGVFDGSIQGLHKLNELGYGIEGSGLILNLVYNPVGPYLPPPQQVLQEEYKKHLSESYGVQFNHLFTIANMPIQRFGSALVSKGQFDEYMKLLKGAFQDSNLGGVMCRNLISVDWQGYVYDCDFNQMLKLPAAVSKKPKTHIAELVGVDLAGKSIVVLDHCYGCTAGQGSSCAGALS